MKYILLALLVLMILIMLFIASVLLVMWRYGKKYIVDNISILERLDTVIVLGAGVRPDGNPCDLLADRIKTGVEAYLSNGCNTILLTGEEKDETYNEVLVMKRWIKKNYEEIDNDIILLDGLGLCTYDSMYRAKYVFNINKAIISTNRYHLPRAIYIARRLGIKVYGIPSDLRQYDRMKKYKRRELIAQLKDYLVVNYIKIKMKFLKKR